jgi:hypothetical protein
VRNRVHDQRFASAPVFVPAPVWVQVAVNEKPWPQFVNQAVESRKAAVRRILTVTLAERRGVGEKDVNLSAPYARTQLEAEGAPPHLAFAVLIRALAVPH